MFKQKEEIKGEENKIVRLDYNWYFYGHKLSDSENKKIFKNILKFIENERKNKREIEINSLCGETGTVDYNYVEFKVENIDIMISFQNEELVSLDGLPAFTTKSHYFRGIISSNNEKINKEKEAEKKDNEKKDNEKWKREYSESYEPKRKELKNKISNL